MSISKNYELMYIASPELTKEADMENLKQQVSQEIAKFKGKIIASESWGKKRLAYSIKKQWEGYYNVVSFSLVENKLSQLDKILKLEPKILRCLITKYDHKTVRSKPKRLAVKKLDKLEEEKTALVIEQAKRKIAASRKLDKQTAVKTKADLNSEKISLEELDKKIDEVLEKELM